MTEHSDRGSRALTPAEILKAFEARTAKRKETEEAFLGVQAPVVQVPDPDFLASEMKNHERDLDLSERRKKIPFNVEEALREIYKKMSKGKGVEFINAGGVLTLIHKVSSKKKGLAKSCYCAPLDVDSKKSTEFEKRMGFYKQGAQIVEGLFRANNKTNKWQISSKIEAENPEEGMQYSHFEITIKFTIQAKTAV
ncbi:MAG: hypothetical protein WCV72_03110 [Patescibacteria group bacterium]